MTDKELKAAFVAKLKSMEVPEWLDEVDVRIGQYIRYVRENCEGERDRCNVDQVAACCKFLRCARVYGFDAKHVRRYVKMAEGLKLDSLDGKRTYPMTAAQVFIVAGLHGFLKTVTLNLFGKDVTEERKLVQDGILFVARKFGKTQLDAWESIDDFLFGDNDAETHIVSNSLDQSKIAYRAIVDMLKQLDPDGTQIRFTQQEITWRDGKRRAIYPHTAGAKAKDGAKASLVIADEYGSARYVKDHCDMSNALEVYLSSMGTRKNHLSIISTTAGRVVEGAFETLLKSYQQNLYKELETASDEPLDTDSQFLYACHPDAWEYDEEHYKTENLWHKCNPHCGVTIQPNFYREEWEKTKGNPEHYKEVVTKLFNQFVSDSSKPWIQPDDVRRLQVPLPGGATRITELNKREWMCFAGFDFSKTDDLCAVSYLCYSPRHKIFFCDMDAWICEKNLEGHPNSTLYTQWAREGWIHVCKSNIIDDSVAVDALQEKWDNVVYVQFGYDSYDSGRFMGHIKNWMESIRRQQGYDQKTLNRYMQWAFHTVSQTFGNYNAVCSQLKDYVLERPQRVWFSKNPMWAWGFGNCVLMESNDSYENVKPVKRYANSKVDHIQALLSCLILLNGYTPFK